MESCTQVCGHSQPSIGAANPWPGAKLPRGPAAVLAALHMRAPLPDRLAELSEADWLRAVDFADKSLLTLPLRRASREYLPPWLRDRTDADAANNRQRVGRATDLYRALDERLRSAGIECGIL